jgi:hypothetical protein
MLNRTKTAASDALDARRAIGAEMREQLREIPHSPFEWHEFDPGSALSRGSTVDLRLVHMSRLLCTAPARSAELRVLWNECVITAAFAWRLAPRVGGDPRSSALAGLLHRLGDLLTIRAIGAVEYALRMRLDGASKAELCVEHGTAQLERAVRAWQVPPRAAATAAEWRRLSDFPGVAADATTVYLARLFALELISPEFCAPGVLEHAAEEAGVVPAALDDVRRDPSVKELLGGLLSITTP